MASLALCYSDTLPLAISWHYAVGEEGCACVCVLKRPGANGHHCQCSDASAGDSRETLQRNHIHHFPSCRCRYSMTGSGTGSCKNALSSLLLRGWFSKIKRKCMNVICETYRSVCFRWFYDYMIILAVQSWCNQSSHNHIWSCFSDRRRLRKI